MRGFAPFSVFVGIVMLGIAVAVAASVQSQVNAYTYQIQQRGAKVQSAFTSDIFTMDSITTFAQALRAALYSTDFTYQTDLTQTDRDIIKSAAEDFIKAISQETVYVGGYIISTAMNDNGALEKAMTVNFDKEHNVVDVKIAPKQGAIPLAEMNIYPSEEAYSDKKPAQSIQYPLFPVGTTTSVFAYVPVSGIDESINDVKNRFKDVNIFVGFAGTKGAPEMEAVVNGTVNEENAWKETFSVSDYNFPLKALLQNNPVKKDDHYSYAPSTLETKISNWVKKYLKGYKVVAVQNIKYADAKTEMPFRKFVCFTGAFAKAVVADPTKNPTLCVDVTDGKAVKQVVDTDKLGKDPAKLPYTYVKEMTITFSKSFKDSCAPGGEVSPQMVATVNLAWGTPPKTPEKMDMNQNARMPPAQTIDQKIQSGEGGYGDYYLPWGESCGNLSLDNYGTYTCTQCTYYICNSSYEYCEQSKGSSCSGRYEGDCEKANTDRTNCWNTLDSDYKTCVEWSSSVLGGYIPDGGWAYCGGTGKNYNPSDDKGSQECTYCNSSTCGSSCDSGTMDIASDPNDWWSGRQGIFLRADQKAFEFNAVSARKEVLKWIQQNFVDTCERVLDEKLCGDVLKHINPPDNHVYVLDVSDPKDIADKLVVGGGGLLSITVVNTDKVQDGQVKWTVKKAAVVYCNSSQDSVVCKTVAGN